MSDPTQVRFAGASVRNFNCNAGWGSQTSQLTVNLVEDVRNGDTFIIPQVGSPAYFLYESFMFAGLIQKWSAQGSLDGLPLFQIIMTDPREILMGVQLIISGYTGITYSVPNLYNIYGYLENTLGFGSSDINDAGIPWQKIRDAFLTLQSSTKINFRGYEYTLDLTQLPQMSESYRIGGGISISLMEYIDIICNDASCDYFFNLQDGNVIRLVTISRRDNPGLGLLSQYISSTNGVIGKETGVELRNEITSKFLVGGKTSHIYFNNRIDGDEATPGDSDAYKFSEDNPNVLFDEIFDEIKYDEVTEFLRNQTVSQYWGLDSHNNVILPELVETYFSQVFRLDNPTLPKLYCLGIRLDTRMLEVNAVSESYITNEAEMRSVLAGQASWENFLWYHDSLQNSLHYLKATTLGIGAGADMKRFRDFVDAGDISGFAALHPLDFSPLRGKLVKIIADATGTSHEENISILYNYLLNIAQTFYGKQFMVRVPFVLGTATENQDIVGDLTTTLEPSEGGYLEETAINDAISNNYMPVDVFKFEIQDGRIQPYVRFRDANFLDVSALSTDDYALGTEFHQKRKLKNEEILSLFVKCDINPNLVFLDRSTLESPRAVLSLPAPVRNLTWSADAVEDRAAFDKLFKDAIIKKLVDNTVSLYDALFAIDGVFATAYPTYLDFGASDEENIAIWAFYYYSSYMFNKVGIEHLFYGGEGLPMIPDLAAVPLMSNINTYGPWYVIGEQGRVEFEQDENLVPWLFGGYSLLNAAANARVEEALSNQLEAEAGAIEVPGAPGFNIGDNLINGGPYVTNIDVSVGENGVRTNYRFETWTQRFGRYAKQNIDRVNKLVQATRDERQKTYNILAKLGTKTASTGFFNSIAIKQVINRREPSSSSSFLLGENLPTGSSIKPNVTIAPTYNVAAAIGGIAYSGKALMTMDGLLRPFSTSPSQFWNLPHFETPTSSGTSGRSVNELNPFQTGHDIHTIAQGSVIPDETHLADMRDSWKRPLALRGPLVVAGWGYNTNNKPIPNERLNEPTNYSDVFASGYLNKSHLWKVGPVDIKWHDTRKVWVTGGASVRIATMVTDLYGGQTGSGELYNLQLGSTVNGIIQIRDVIGDSYGRYVIVPSGTRVIVAQEETTGGYILTGAPPR